MKKNLYIAPSIKLHEITATSILEGSGKGTENISVGSGSSETPTPDSNGNLHTDAKSSWGDIW